MSTQTHAALDAAIRAHFASEFGDDAAYVSHWTIAAAGVDQDGEPRIMGDHSDPDHMADWMVRGLLHSALAMLDSSDDE